MDAQIHEAMLYERLPNHQVHCSLCSQSCLIGDERRGVCQVRENRGGTLYTLVYGRLIARHVDPIEKKPLYHFYPGSDAYSIAAPGCNFRCRWCQNADISQMPRDLDLIGGQEADPQEVVDAALAAGCRSIAYTYTEPTIFFEYAYDIARPARAAGLANVFVTNGFMTQAMLETLHPHLDAANVDLKAFRDETYRRYVGARLQPVLDNLKTMKALGVWVEVMTLIIPGINSDEGELRDAARFIAGELGPETPWHVSRFFPAYRMADTPPTALSKLQRAVEIGREEGLRYVYAGNVRTAGETFCHQCGQLLIHRAGYQVLENLVRSGGTCPECGTPLAGVGVGAILDADGQGKHKGEAEGPP